VAGRHGRGCLCFCFFSKIPQSAQLPRRVSIELHSNLMPYPRCTGCARWNVPGTLTCTVRGAQLKIAAVQAIGGISLPVGPRLCGFFGLIKLGIEVTCEAMTMMPQADFISR
jgi:hypothetical protein